MSRSPAWSEREVAQLLELAGDVPFPILSRTYNDWAQRSGLPVRSRKSLLLKAQRCGASLRVVGAWLTTGGIAGILNLPPATVESWTVRYPSLPRRKFGRGRQIKYIHRPALRSWARTHMHLFGGLERSRLVMLFEDEQLADQIVAEYPRRPMGMEATAVAVRCLDDGRMWPSIMAAARAVYVSHAALWHGLRERRPVAGLRFETVEQQAA